MAKVNKSNVTKKNARLSALFFWLSILVTIIPVIVYVIIGFCNGEVHQKLTLGITVIIAIILVGINVIFKYHIRSILWVLILGIYFCTREILPLLLIVAIGTILDEFVLTPLHKKYKNRKTINYEIDKRIP